MIDFKQLDTPDKILIGLAVFFSATISLPLILDLNNSGDTSLSILIYIISGVLVIGSGIIFVIKRSKLQRNKIEEQEKNKYIVDEKDNDFLLKVRKSNIPMEDILFYINHRSTRYSLIDHELFTSGYRKCLDSIEKHKHHSSNEGQNFIIYKYHLAILQITIDRIKTFLVNNYSVIDSDVNNLDIDIFIELIYNIIKKSSGNSRGMGYEDYAINVIGVDNIFIIEYNKVHHYAVEFLDNALCLIKSSNYSSDYNRYLSILNAVLLYLKETFSDNHIKRVFKINGRCQNLFDKAYSAIQISGKDFSEIVKI